MFNINKDKKILLISNAIVHRSICDIIDQYDYIIRFNSGANPLILSSDQYKHLYGDRVDLCVINGHHTGKWGDLSGFTNKHILFNFYIHHPENKHIRLKFQEHTDHIYDIKYAVYHKFSQTYKYREKRLPTTGLMTIYYFAEYLGLNVTCLNFFMDNEMKHFVLLKNITFNVHDYESEINIFSQIQCEKIYYK